MFDWFSDPNAWISLLTLTILEIVLGVDNIIFISILAGKLPPAEQGKARNIGLILALVTRILLLSFIFLLTKLTKPLFSVLGHGLSGKDLVMLLGGLFLVWKSIKEIHHAMEGQDHEKSKKVAPTLTSVIATIIFVDILFSLDSVITAVGLVGGESGPKSGTLEAAVANLHTALYANGMPAAPIAESMAKVQVLVGEPAAAGHGNGNLTIMILAIVISMATSTPQWHSPSSSKPSTSAHEGKRESLWKSGANTDATSAPLRVVRGIPDFLRRRGSKSRCNHARQAADLQAKEA